jgi:hypothetical protein
VEYASTVPVALSKMGIVFCVAVATTTGTGRFFAAACLLDCASEALQAAHK